MNTNRALVTGSHRSGSTWVGRVISQNRKVDAIIEPFNLNRIRRFKKVEYAHWYPMILDDSTEGSGELRDLMQYYLDANYTTFFQQLFEAYEGHNMYDSLKKRLRRSSKPFKLIKDPMAVFSIPWLESTFGLKPLILLRHPAAFALSIKEKNWSFDFDNLLQQDVFFKDALLPLKEEVETFKNQENERSIVENAALFWKVCYTQVLDYQKKYPNWYYISHEALSTNPLQEFEHIFNYFDIDFTTQVEEYVLDSTQATTQEKHKRNSRENMLKWQNKLTTFEKDTIYQITKPVADRFYDPF